MRKIAVSSSLPDLFWRKRSPDIQVIYEVQAILDGRFNSAQTSRFLIDPDSCGFYRERVDMNVVSRMFLVSSMLLLTQLLLHTNNTIASEPLCDNPFPNDLCAREKNNQWHPRYFRSQQETAKAAADLYNPRSIRENREYIGVILEEDGLFRYTVASGDKGADKISIKVPIRDWENAVAFWHTHGDEKEHHQYFSDTDTALVKRFGKPFYLADYTGILKVFRPGDKKISRFRAARLGLPRRHGYAYGSRVRDESDQLVRVNTIQRSRNT